jgi:hypothetical protein
VLPADSDLQPVFDQCTSWSLDVLYDPRSGFLPDEDPTHPWTAFLGNGTAEIVDGRLVVSGAGPGTSSKPHYVFEDPHFADPTNPMIVLQVRSRFDEIVPGLENRIALAGVHDGDRHPGYGLWNYASDRVALLGNTNEAPTVDSTYVPWDYGADTTYSLVVVKGDAAYLGVGDGPTLSVPYYDLTQVIDDLGASIFVTGNVVGEYSFVQICVCEQMMPLPPIFPPVVYSGETIDQKMVLKRLDSDGYDFSVLNLTQENFVLEPVTAEAKLAFEIDVRRLDELDTGKYSYNSYVNWEIVDVTTGRKVRTLEGVTAIGGIGTTPIVVTWDGKDKHGADAPAGVYMYKATFKLRSQKTGSQGKKVLDQVEAPWRLVAVDRDDWVVDYQKEALLLDSIPDPAGAPNLSIRLKRSASGTVTSVFGEDFRVPFDALSCAAGDAEARSRCFLSVNAEMFGIVNVAQELLLNNIKSTDFGRTLVMFDQRYEGYRVPARGIRLDVSASDEVLSVHSSLATPLTGPARSQIQAIVAGYDSQQGLDMIRTHLSDPSLQVLTEEVVVWPVLQAGIYDAIPAMAVKAGTPSLGAQHLGIVDAATHEVLFTHPLVFYYPDAIIKGSAIHPDMSPSSVHPECDPGVPNDCTSPAHPDCSEDFVPSVCVRECTQTGDCAALGYVCFDPLDPANSEFGGYCYSGYENGYPTDPYDMYVRQGGPSPSQWQVSWYSDVLATNLANQRLAAGLEELVAHHWYDLDINGWDNGGSPYTVWLPAQCAAPPGVDATEYANPPDSDACTRPHAGAEDITFSQWIAYWGKASPSSLDEDMAFRTLGHEWGHVLHASDYSPPLDESIFLSQCMRECFANTFGAIFMRAKHGTSYLLDSGCDSAIVLDAYADDPRGLNSSACVVEDEQLPYAMRSRFDWSSCVESETAWGAPCQSINDCPTYHLCMLDRRDGVKKCRARISAYDAAATGARMVKILAEGPAVFASERHQYEDIGIIDRPLGIDVAAKIFHRAAAGVITQLDFFMEIMLDIALNFNAINPNSYSATVDALGATGFFPLERRLSGYRTDRTPVKIRFDAWAWSTDKSFLIWKQANTGNIKIKFDNGTQQITQIINANTYASPEAVVAGSNGQYLVILFQDQTTSNIRAYAIHKFGVMFGPTDLGPGFRTGSNVGAAVYQGRLYIFFPDMDNELRLTMAWCPLEDLHTPNWHIFNSGTYKKAISENAIWPGPSAIAATGVNGLPVDDHSLFVVSADYNTNRISVVRIDQGDNVVDEYVIPAHYPSYRTITPIGITARRSAFPVIVPPNPPQLLERNYLYLVWRDGLQHDIYTSILQKADPVRPWFTRSARTMYTVGSGSGVLWEKGRSSDKNVRAVYSPYDPNGLSGTSHQTIYSFYGYGRY